MKDSLRRESVVDIQDDGDPYWFNNPQYRLSADEPLEVGHLPTPGGRNRYRLVPHHNTVVLH